MSKEDEIIRLIQAIEDLLEAAARYIGIRTVLFDYFIHQTDIYLEEIDQIVQEQKDEKASDSYSR